MSLQTNGDIDTHFVTVRAAGNQWVSSVTNLMSVLAAVIAFEAELQLAYLLCYLTGTVHT